MSLTTTPSEKPQYLPKEVIIKLKRGVPSSIILTKLYKNYSIKSLDKVFKESRSASEELNYFKQRFSKEIASGKRRINEEEMLKTDFSLIYKLSFNINVDIKTVIKKLTTLPGIEYAEPIYLFKTSVSPNDPLYQDQYPDNIVNRDLNWNPSYDYQWNLKRINAESAWDKTTGSSDITIAIVDTGIDYTHQELGACTFDQVKNNFCQKITPGYNFVNSTDNPLDDAGHGTHVAGLVSSLTNNQQGIASLNWQARLMPVKVLDVNGVGPHDRIAQGIIYAASNGAKIINLSLGSGPLNTIPQVIKSALDYAYNSGSVIIAAAGNEGDRYFCNYPNWPSDYRSVIEVAASKEDDYPASYSNCSKDIAAPGGQNANIISLASSLVNWSPNYLINNLYVRKSGTSMATPHVSALVGLILSLHSNYHNEEVRAILKTSAKPIWPYIYGAGLIDAQKALSTTPPPLVSISSPAEFDQVTNKINISAFIKDVTVPSENHFLGISAGWNNNCRSFKGDGIIEIHPPSANYSGIIGSWDPCSYPDGKYTICFYGRYSDSVKINLAKNNCPTPTPSPIPTATPTITPIPPSPTPSFKQALVFPISSAQNYVRIQQSDKLKLTQSFTIEVWIKPDKETLFGANAINPHFILAKEAIGGEGYGASLEISNKKASFYLTVDNNGQKELVYLLGTTVMSSNQWYFLKVLRDKDKISLFVNGNKEAEKIFPSNATEKYNTYLNIGCLGITNTNSCFSQYYGLIDEVRISSIVRNDTEIPTAPFTNDTNTIGLWHFDGNTVDESNNHLDGQVFGNPYFTLH